MPNLITALDMHIEVLQGLQKVDSFQQDMFQPEEIDLHLNKQQDRFIEQLVNKRFEDEQLRLDYIKNLIVKNRSLSLYSPAINDKLYEPNMLYGLLPDDYLHLINDRSTIAYSEYQPYCKDIGETPVKDQTEYMANVPFPFPNTPQNSYYTGLKFTVSSTDLYLSRFDNPGAALGSKIKDTDYIGPIVKDILENATRLEEGDQIYWERYRNYYLPKQFIYVSKVPITNISIEIFQEDGVTQDAISNGSVGSEIYKAIDFAAVGAIKGITKEQVNNQLSELDDLYDFKKNVFYTTTKKEPHSTLSERYYHVYRGKSFLITGVTIDYIRRPRQISLSLNQSCELAGPAPSLIVDQTVEYLKLLIENPSYQGILQDNQLRNQNNITNG